MKTTFTLLVILTMLGWFGGPASAQPRQAQQTYIIWIDITRSIKQTDIQRWHATFERNLLPTIACGDRVVLFPIQKDTTQSAPWMEWVTTSLDDEPTKSELLACRKAQAELKRRVRTLFQELEARPTTAGLTDILGTLERLDSYRPRLGQGPITVLYLSDMVQASPELNLEKVKLSEEKIGPLTDEIIARHKQALAGWAGVTVRCWLNKLDADAASPLNAQPILRMFYHTLFLKTGSTLSEFQAL